MDGAVVERTASALLIYHLYLDERHVGTISLETFRVLDAGELDVMRLARCFYGVTACLLLGLGIF